MMKVPQYMNVRKCHVSTNIKDELISTANVFDRINYNCDRANLLYAC
jgi:hypothetical protein